MSRKEVLLEVQTTVNVLNGKLQSESYTAEDIITQFERILMILENSKSDSMWGSVN